MNINTALRAIEGKRSSEVAESGNVITSAEELAALLREVSEGPTHEIEKLINQLQRLHTQLHDARNRIERKIAHYTEMSQQTIQLTAIISDGMKKLHATELPRDNTLDMVAAIREGVMEQLKRERSGRPGSSSK